MSDVLTFQEFSRRVNTLFRIQFAGAPGEEAELVSCSGKDLAGVESFSLLFRVRQQQPYPQKIYAVEHDELGKFEIFIVPVSRDADGVCYEAVFNRMVSHD